MSEQTQIPGDVALGTFVTPQEYTDLVEWAKEKGRDLHALIRETLMDAVAS